jgi:uncharacterized protein YkwD
MRVTDFLAASAVSLLVAGCVVPMQMPGSASEPAAPAASTSTAYARSEGRIFDLINAERSRQGLRPLAFNAQLDRMAHIQAANMAHFQKMAHTLPEAQLPTLGDRARYVGYPYREIAENIALGYPTPEAVVQGWMNSTGHRRNILNSGVEETGIAIVRSAAGGLYYAQVFGRQGTSF